MKFIIDLSSKEEEILLKLTGDLEGRSINLGSKPDKLKFCLMQTKRIYDLLNELDLYDLEHLKININK